MSLNRTVASCLILLITPILASGQSNVSTIQKFAYSENCGWINFRDAGSPVGSQGVRVGPTFLSGFAWGENIGWINVGDGTPANGSSYANAAGSDFGVNRDPSTGQLSGLAWGENVGWINFSGGALASPPNPARVDAGAGRIRGYAWGENIGWINMDSASTFVGLRCPADFNNDGSVTPQDIFDYLNAWFAGVPEADFNLDNAITPQDIFDFLNAWFAGC